MELIRIIAVSTLLLAIHFPAVAAEKKSIGEASSDQIGRYQLIQGKYEHATNAMGNPMTTDAMYKLDTAAGKLYICYITQTSQVTERGNVIMSRTCEDFEQV